MPHGKIINHRGYAMRAYYRTYNEDLLDLIPPDAKVVLEVGCAAGALAAAYRRINPGVGWIGVEANEQAAEAAKEHIDEVYCQRVEEFDWYDIDDGVDVLICGDVLEHLIDPWTVLRKLADHVKPGGQVLACIPNVQHYRVIMALLRGEWIYANDGLLDRTHLRFFDLDGIKQLFEQAKLETFEIRGRPYGNEHHVRFMQLFKDKLTDEEWETLRKRSSAYQYIVRAVKPPCEIIPLWIADRPGEGCCERPRLTEPLRFLRTIPGVKLTDNVGDITIIQRDFRGIYPPDRETGVTIAEWDDDPRMFPDLVANDFHAIRAAHAVMCSTGAIAYVVQPINPNVAVFPNQIAELPPPPVYRDGPASIFCAWQNREDDWTPIVEPLNRILADHPEVSVHVVNDRKFFDALATENKDFTPFISDYNRYRAAMRSCDIALSPLLDTPANACKSDIKFLECAAEGVYLIESDDIINLGMIIDNPTWRYEAVDRAYRHVAEYRLLGQHYRERYEWFLSLISQKSRLDRERDERLASRSSATAPSRTSHAMPAPSAV
jgi:2-polyprenyl-3-methyl-5-hydroxy-6-metoxy-1,4-benzoquinol methylase